MNHMKEFLESNGYFNVRELPDGWIGCLKHIYTTELCIDMDQFGYERRYSYNTQEEAVAACDAMKSVKDEALPGWTKRYPIERDER